MKLTFKKMLKKELIFSYNKIIVIFAFLTILFIYHGWLKKGIILGGDFRVRPLEFFIDFVRNYKYIWWESLYGGFNPVYCLYLSKLPIYFVAGLLALFSIPYGVIQRIIWLFPVPIISFLGMYFLSNKITKSKVASVISATYYATAPVILERIYRSHLWMSNVYALAPLALYFSLKKEFTIREIMIFSILLNIMIWFEIREAVLFILTIFTISILYLYIYKGISIKIILKRYLYVSFLISLSNMFWIIPFLSQVQNIENVIPSSIISHSQVFYSGRYYGNILNAMILLPKNWYLDYPIVKLLSIFSSIFLFIFVVWYTLLKISRFRDNDKKFITLLFIYYLILVFISKGSYPPLGEMFVKIILKIPYLAVYKSTHKFAMVGALVFSILLAISADNFIKNGLKSISQYKKVLSYLVIFTLIILSNSFLVFGYFENFGVQNSYEGWKKYKGEQNMFYPISISEEYKEIWKIVSKDNYYKTLWLPTIHRYRYTSSNTPYLDTNFYISSSNYGKEIFIPPNGKINWKNLEKIDDLNKYLGITNIKYIVLKPSWEPEWYYSKSKYTEYRKLLDSNFVIIYPKRTKIPLNNLSIIVNNGKVEILNNSSILYTPTKGGNYSIKIFTTIPKEYDILTFKLKGTMTENIWIKIKIFENKKLIREDNLLFKVSQYNEDPIIIKLPNSGKNLSIDITIEDIYETDKIKISDFYFQRDAPLLYKVKDAFPIIYILRLPSNSSNIDANIYTTKRWVKFLSYISYAECNYTKINPTLWKVKVNATKPFMLSFAESYDPLWEARIYKNGKLVEKVRSIPLYSVINGFWINETGNLEIVIRYTPQDWFELGLKISGLTFIGCIGYIFYDWRREKGDRWTKEIERRLSKTISKFTAKMRRK